MTIDTFLRTCAGISLVGLDTAVFASSAFAGAVFLGPTHPLVNGCYRHWARGVLRGCGARLRTRGDAHLDPTGRFVLVSNHLSDLDAPAIIASFFHHDVRFVAKEELARVPLFGHALRATGNVIVTRS
ncbi:MAG: lysophospholipid acyltransferase family protein, partial [Myxococcota bacterium]